MSGEYKLSQKDIDVINRLYLASLILAAIGCAHALARAAVPGATALSSVEGMVGNILNKVSSRVGRVGDMGGGRVGKGVLVLDYLLTLCIPTAILLLAIAVGYQNQYYHFDN